MATPRKILRDNITELGSFACKFKHNDNLEMYIYTMSKCVALEWFEAKIEKHDIQDETSPRTSTMNCSSTTKLPKLPVMKILP